MKALFLFLLGLLAGCAALPPSPPPANSPVGVACQIDGQVVPVADAVLPVIDPTVTPLVSADEAILHPLVQDYCTGKGGFAVTVAAPATPTAPATVTVTIK